MQVDYFQLSVTVYCVFQIAVLYIMLRACYVIL